MSDSARVIAFTSWKNWPQLANQDHTDWWYLQKEGHDVTFWRDKSNTWFLGPTSDALAIAEKEKSRSPTVTLGSSMGGFAAAVVGSLLRVRHAICIVPQTIVGQGAIDLGDRRFQADYERIATMADLQAKCDLRSFIMTAPETVFHLIVGSESPVDLKHLNRVRDLPNVHAQVIAGIGHGDVARHCKECGLLAQFLWTDN